MGFGERYWFLEDGVSKYVISWRKEKKKKNYFGQNPIFDPAVSQNSTTGFFPDCHTNVQLP